MQEQELTHWKKLVNPDYIGSYELKEGEERIVEIISVGLQMVKGTDGKEKECTVAVLKGEKPFILNRTNCKILTKIYKTPYIQNWAGKRIIIFSAPVKAFGEVVDALRIKPTEPMLPPLIPTGPKWPGAVKALKDKATTIEAILKNYSLTKEHKEQLLTESK